MSHTPGPWEIRNTNIHYGGHHVCPHCGKHTREIPASLNVATRNWGVCMVEWYDKGEEQTQLANAHLISAAPIGYEIAEAILAEVTDGLDRSEWLVKKAREFMDKAEGRE